MCCSPLGMASFLVMQVLYILAFRAVPGPGLVRAWPIACGAVRRYLGDHELADPRRGWRA